ncbi:hypothetical protein [Klebsiella pneumoniae]|uniref:hypothetical protein n=1 Tax=Klebsiella pneumoniae TaxID=573 RepID=UPI00244973CF|nr:hypothetical protein [Klebsiella pneumoniae]WGI00678.1 hypothetical protein QDV38_02605 [Klebsiella pneumoniae]
MNLPTVVFVSLNNGDEILCVNGALIMQSEADYSVHGVHETATTLAKALGVKLVEYNNTPVPDYDEWTIDDVLSALPELPFTCGECGRVYDDSAVCMSDDCPGHTTLVSEVSENRVNNVVKFLINSYQLTTEEAEDFAERGNYSYVLSGNLASEHYFQKKKATLRAG